MKKAFLVIFLVFAGFCSMSQASDTEDIGNSQGNLEDLSSLAQKIDPSSAHHPHTNWSTDYRDSSGMFGGFSHGMGGGLGHSGPYGENMIQDRLQNANPKAALQKNQPVEHLADDGQPDSSDAK